MKDSKQIYEQLQNIRESNDNTINDYIEKNKLSEKKYYNHYISLQKENMFITKLMWWIEE